MRRLALCLAMALVLVGAQRGFAQGVRIWGAVRDAHTGQPLPLANIWVEGTYRGTTSNAQGEYVLEIPSVPATLRVRYIGYQSQAVTIRAQAQEGMDFLLQPALIELPPVVVSGEDPAVAIMRGVIRYKEARRDRLRTFAAEAYSRLSVANDTAVVMVMESTSRLFWDRTRGTREVITSRRQTANVPAAAAIFALGFPNFYDDDVEVAGTRFIGVTHPDAPAHYQFRLLGVRAVDDVAVYDIAVSPRGRLQPCFEGNLSVVDSALVVVDLRPGQALQLPMPVQELQVRYVQHFSTFGLEFWLPVNAYEQGELRVGVPGLYFPGICYERLVALADYQVNVSLPDTVYGRRRVVSIDSVAVRQDTLLSRSVRAVPLAGPELVAYEQVDSTWTLSRLYRPRGPLARLLKTRVQVGEEGEGPAEARKAKRGRKSGHLVPDVRFNRVEGLHLGGAYRVQLAKNWEVGAAGGYKTGPHKWSYQAKLVVPLAKNQRLSLLHRHDLATLPGSSLYPQTLHSVFSVVGWTDHFDYFWQTRSALMLEGTLPTWHLLLEAGVAAARDRSAEARTDFSLFGGRDRMRPNPTVDEGRVGLVRLRVRLGKPSFAWSVVSQRGAELVVEYAQRGLLASDFSFVSYRLLAGFGTATLLRRRLLPNRLDVQVIAGAVQGEPPVQKLGTVEGRMAFLTPFGALRTLEGWYHGQKYLGLFWEHEFRSLPFELLGLRWLVQKNVGVVLHGAAARTWYSRWSQHACAQSRVPDRFHQEIGLSLTGILGVVRCDVTRRLDATGWSIGAGVTRLF